MTQKQWIEVKISEGLSNSQLYHMYKQFKEKTGSSTTYDNYCSLVRKTKRKSSKSYSDVVAKMTKEEAGPNMTLVSTSSEIKTLEQLISYAKIDLEKYEITKHIINQWTTWSTRLGTKIPLENYQVKVFLSKIDKSEETDEELLESLIEDAKKYAPKYPQIKHSSHGSDNALEICLFDHHFGQLSWGKETGDKNYDIKISKEMALDSMSDILSKSKYYNPEKIIIPIGNDFFNVNDQTNTTQKGTPQAEDERWQKTFVSGREIWVKILEMCYQAAPTSAIWIPGNHDPERSFHLCDSLYCWFNNSEIEIDHTPKPQKVLTWGKNSIMYTHGCNERRNDYPTVFATTFPVQFSNARYRAIHLGDKHHLNKSALTVAEDVYSVDVKIKPSLVPLNAWSAGKAYKAIARTEAEIWNKTDGLVADLYCNM